MGRLVYKELSNAKFKEQRNVVISEAFNKNNESIGYSIAEQLVTEENGKELNLFQKRDPLLHGCFKNTGIEIKPAQLSVEIIFLNSKIYLLICLLLFRTFLLLVCHGYASSC